jgi:hypothetical protein
MRPLAAAALVAVAAAVLSPAQTLAAQKLPLSGELRLDMDAPIITLSVGDVAFRLRVSLNQKRLIELNPDAVRRIEADPPKSGFAFESGFDALVGRERLRGVQAAAKIKINGRKMIVTLASHGRDCCKGVDGEIGLGLLPYETIVMERNGGVSGATRTLRYDLDDHPTHGPQARQTIGTDSIFLQFSLEQDRTVATGSAGAILARAHDGRLDDAGEVEAAFGIKRPASTLHFGTPANVAGFAYEDLIVRTADFGGSEQYPRDPDKAGDIMVQRRVPQQEAWPAVLIGRDRLDGCDRAEIDRRTNQLSLRCTAN